jgi:hypothetical protein
LFFCLFLLPLNAYLPLDHVSDVAWSLDNKRIAVVQKECSEIVMAKLSVGAAPVQSTTTIPEVTFCLKLWKNNEKIQSVFIII